MTAGIWLGHKDQGFDYHNPQQVADQLESVRQTVLKYRNAPALLVWGIGNEMENDNRMIPFSGKRLKTSAAMVKET